jgi:hypothetical protein
VCRSVCWPEGETDAIRDVQMEKVRCSWKA